MMLFYKDRWCDGKGSEFDISNHALSMTRLLKERENVRSLYNRVSLPTKLPTEERTYMEK